MSSVSVSLWIVKDAVVVMRATIEGRGARKLNGRVLGLGELFGADGTQLERRLAFAPE
jgi:hypothetical protein